MTIRTRLERLEHVAADNNPARQQEREEMFRHMLTTTYPTATAEEIEARMKVYSMAAQSIEAGGYGA